MFILAYLYLSGILSSSAKEAQPTQQDVRIRTEPNSLHRVGWVAPTATMTYNTPQENNQ